MSDPFLGEVRCFGFNFAPRGWALCNGQTMAIQQYSALFSLLGTTYGGNGQTTFALPNLQGQIPMHWGDGPGGFDTVIGEVLGASTVTLAPNQMPTHRHVITSAVVPPGALLEHSPQPTSNSYIGPSNPDAIYRTNGGGDSPFSGNAISSTGGSQPHENMQPYLAVNFCIALEGIFPARN